MEKKLNVNRGIFYVIIMMFVLYASVFIFMTSFELAGQRCFSLFDDAMISMTYAKNLAQGNGLVWIPGGEKVEGFTNPLWVLYMSALHLLPVNPLKISLLVQLSGLMFMLVTLFYVRELALHISEDSPIIATGAVILTAFYYPMIYWSLMGLEVSILTAILACAAWNMLKLLQCNRFSLWIYVLLGVSTLIRIDMAVPYIGVWLVLLIGVPDHRKRNLLWGVSMLAVFLSSQTIFRIMYYGALLPNTYYLKMTGMPVAIRIARGAYVFFIFALRMNMLLFALPFVFTFLRFNRYKLAILWLFFMQILYSMYVGGDSWEEWGGSNRFISIAMPFFLILFSYALFTAIKWIVSVIERGITLSDTQKSTVVSISFMLMLVVSLISFNRYALPEFLLIKKPYQVDLNKEMIARSMIINNITKPDATIAVTLAGAIPYFSDREFFDILGKCDSFIAHQDIHFPKGRTSLLELKPGHLKWDYDYTYGRLKPDVIPHLWGKERGDAWPYVKNIYTNVDLPYEGEMYNFFLRIDSDSILWEKYGM